MSLPQVLITGCSSGIGRAAAQVFARAGYQVFATARRPEAIADLRAPNVAAFALDVSDPDSIQRAVNAARERGPIDILVNNAGYGQWGPLIELPHDKLVAQFETNVFGLMDVTKAVVNGPRGMLEQRRGRIVNIGSILGQAAIPFSGAYVASKFALRGLSDSLRLELAPFGITVVQIEPGAIKSKFAENVIRNAADVITRHDSAYEFVRPRMEKTIKQQQQGALATEKCARAIFRAATTRHPGTRYLVGADAKAFKVGIRIVPEKWMDQILRRVFGLSGHR